MNLKIVVDNCEQARNNKTKKSTKEKNVRVLIQDQIYSIF